MSLDVSHNNKIKDVSMIKTLKKLHAPNDAGID